MEFFIKNIKSLHNFPKIFIGIVVAFSAYAVWLGTYDMYELNWDHTLHMKTMMQSSIFIKEGWIGYGGTYYKVGNFVFLIFTPVFTLLRTFEVDIQGVLSSLILTNVLSLLGFVYLIFRTFKLETRLLIPLGMLFLSSPLFYWSIRAYPDVMVSAFLGIGSVFLIIYLLINNRLSFLVMAAIFFGMALQGKPSALLILLALAPLLLISKHSLRDLLIFSIVLLLIFLAFGYPQNSEHILKWWKTLQLGDASWYAINKANLDFVWLGGFSKDYVLTTLLPSIPFLFAPSSVTRNIRVSTSTKDLKIFFLGFFLSSFGVVFFLLLKPLSVVTQHYTIITFPVHCLLFLFLSGYLYNAKLKYTVILYISTVIFCIVGIDNVKTIHKKKMQQISCVPHWMTAKEQLVATDVRTVYTPFGIFNEGAQLHQPEDIYSKLTKEGSRQLLTGRYLNRFRDSLRRSKIESSILSKVPEQKNVDKIYEFFYTLASMKESETVIIDNLTIKLIQYHQECDIRRFEVRVENY